MATARLFSRSRQALMPSLLTLKCNTYASLVLSSKELKAIKSSFVKSMDEHIWNTRSENSEAWAKIHGSPFILLKDHISTDNACSNPEGKKLEKYLRDCKDIKFSTEVLSILLDRKLEKFQMTSDEIQNYVMRHLYVLTLKEVIPYEKRYMEDLINEENHFEVEYQWRHHRYHLVVREYSKNFVKLPGRCLRRGLELHMSRIPHKYCLKNRLPKVFKNELLKKLEEDYEILTSNIYEVLPTISIEMMACEIKSLVDHVPGASTFENSHDRFFFPDLPRLFFS